MPSLSAVILTALSIEHSAIRATCGVPLRKFTVGKHAKT